MNFEQTAKELAQLFRLKGYKWRFDGVLKTPTIADILEVLQEGARRLAKESEGTWLETGRLIVIKEAGFIDVYAHHAQLEESKNEQSPADSVPETP